MNIKKIILIIPLFIATLTACDDTKMEWGKDPAYGDVSTSELPLQLVEKISRYKPLKNYTDFTLGVGMGLDMYMDNEAYRNIVNENFNQITVGYAMKHGPMVNSKGELNYTQVDKLMTMLQQAGLSVHGHTLVWHTNQNASYLNSLIAPTVIPAPAGTNLLNNGSFENGMDGWGSWGGSKQTVEVTTDEHIEGSKSLKVAINSSGGTVYSAQIQSPSIPLIVGHHYQISFYIKSDKPGAVRMSFDNSVATPPLGSFWPSNTASDGADNTISTSGTWKQITYDKDHSTATFLAAASSVQFRLDLGMLPNVTYYIDNIVVVDLDAPSVVNLIANGNFDADLTGWSKWNGPDNCMTYVTGTDAFQGGSMKVVNPTDNSGGEWKVQIHSNLTEKLASGTKYTVSYYIRSDAPGSARCSTSGNAMYQSNQATSTAWTLVEWEITGTGAEDGLNFDLGLKAGNYYIDNVLVTKKLSTSSASSFRSGPIIIEKTDAEKNTIITAAMTSWISQMVGHYKNQVHSWDVVNEPMDDGKPSSLKTGKNKAVADFAADEFYWQDYMGKDYAVKAFQLARQYGNPTDKLFINDYNLEYNLAKCDGLIEYVKYIESKGAVVDGIGTQMHIDINSNKNNIIEMFKKLAATGKLIKVTELDIKVNTATPTVEQYAQQSDMYKYVIDTYKQYIPAQQRAGVTIWGVSDNAKEHENWIPNDAPNLWDKDYKRKHAYKGTADGLAGKDVSEDFSGELIY